MLPRAANGIFLLGLGHTRGASFPPPPSVVCKQKMWRWKSLTRGRRVNIDTMDTDTDRLKVCTMITCVVFGTLLVQQAWPTTTGVLPFPHYSTLPTSGLPRGPRMTTADVVIGDVPVLSAHQLPASFAEGTTFNTTDVLRQLLLGSFMFHMPCIGMAHFGFSTPLVLVVLDDAFAAPGANVTSPDVGDVVADWAVSADTALSVMGVAAEDTFAKFVRDAEGSSRKRFLVFVDPDLQRVGTIVLNSVEVVYGCRQPGHDAPELTKRRSATVRVFARLLSVFHPTAPSSFKHEFLVSGLQAQCLQSHHDLISSPETVCT
jgi:hypothetical protein